jgi:hypothetical protein
VIQGPKKNLYVDSSIHELFALCRRIDSTYHLDSLPSETAKFEQSKMTRKYALLGLIALLDEETRVNNEILTYGKLGMRYGKKVLVFLNQKDAPSTRPPFKRTRLHLRKLQLRLLELEVIRLYLKRAKRAARSSGGRQLPAIIPTAAIRSVLSSEASIAGVKGQDPELRVAIGIIKSLQATNRALKKRISDDKTPTKERIMSLVGKCQKKNGTLNVAKLGRELGMSNHTAGILLRKYKIK